MYMLKKIGSDPNYSPFIYNYYINEFLILTGNPYYPTIIKIIFRIAHHV